MNTSIARKIVMALTGFFLITFLIVHLLVNSFSVYSAELFNKGSHFMATNPLIQIMQYALAAGFIIHIGLGLKLTMQNRKARGVNYAKTNSAANSTLASRSMIITGLLVLLFIILHMTDFFWNVKFGDLEHVQYLDAHGVLSDPMQNDYSLMEATFSKPLYVFAYVGSFILLAVHLSHGFASAFQTMGVNHSKWNGLIKTTSYVFCTVIGVGFSVIALFHYFNSCC